jgi:hypothetical protein
MAAPPQSSLDTALLKQQQRRLYSLFSMVTCAPGIEDGCLQLPAIRVRALSYSMPG